MWRIDSLRWRPNSSPISEGVPPMRMSGKGLSDIPTSLQTQRGHCEECLRLYEDGPPAVKWTHGSESCLRENRGAGGHCAWSAPRTCRPTALVRAHLVVVAVRLTHSASPSPARDEWA